MQLRPLERGRAFETPQGHVRLTGCCPTHSTLIHLVWAGSTRKGFFVSQVVLRGSLSSLRQRLYSSQATVRLCATVTVFQPVESITSVS